VIRVLVVDDDFRVADLHAAFVRAVPGFEVVAIALDGAQALAADREHAPDLVLLDMYLPDGLGTDLLPRLSGDALVITAAADSATVRRALGAGAVNYLVKPFGAVELADRLRAYAKYHRHVRTQGTLDQVEIDRAVRLLREGDRTASAVPKGRSAQTATLVLQCLQRADGALSAADVAAELGLSRATAQRYLADLADDGRADVTLRYGTTGRPEHRYVVRGR
jgi:two-component system CitB family response regulator